MRRCEGEDMPKERAEVPPVGCETVAGIWIWKRCGGRSVADGREEGETQLVARREEDRVYVRERSPVFEYRCVGSKVRDDTNGFYAWDVREGWVIELQGSTL